MPSPSSAACFLELRSRLLGWLRCFMVFAVVHMFGYGDTIVEKDLHVCLLASPSPSRGNDLFNVTAASTSMITGCWSLRLSSLEVPALRQRGQTATLRCRYDVEGDDLYSVAWYKDDTEFYRFLPTARKPKTTFPGVAGINVNVKESDDVRVTLTSLSVFSSGQYRCKVNTEAPVFASVTETTNMLVVAPPESDPVISGFEEDHWAPGDTLQLNCTSAKSYPAARLHWAVHGRLITGDLLTPYPLEEDDEGLQTATLGLRLHLRPTLLSSGPVKVSCTSIVSRNISEYESRQRPPGGDGRTTETLYTNTTSILVGSGVGAAHPSTALLLLLLAVVGYTASVPACPRWT
ncbi:uncharacterized protein LOC122369103 isoform X3 [Amphibalanus amphitrite]|uniref:uncharacterized protein LOC122369103 isoform X3 n=1 Tax=Amphibalanus amphitrite TaxID=1232801 RepID=UPI001C91BAA7|nr:uncharacterized protein LOC122369103 isoform X3 [Amphibalanus amphitrite]